MNLRESRDRRAYVIMLSAAYCIRYQHLALTHTHTHESVCGWYSLDVAFLLA